MAPLFAILFGILFVYLLLFCCYPSAISYAIQFGITIVILFGNKVRILSVNIGPTIGQNAHTGSVPRLFRAPLRSESDHDRGLEPLHERAVKPSVLSTTCRYRWGRHYSFLERLLQHPLLNTLLNMHTLKLKC